MVSCRRARCARCVTWRGAGWRAVISCPPAAGRPKRDTSCPCAHPMTYHRGITQARCVGRPLVGRPPPPATRTTTVTIDTVTIDTVNSNPRPRRLVAVWEKTEKLKDWREFCKYLSCAVSHSWACYVCNYSVGNEGWCECFVCKTG